MAQLTKEHLEKLVFHFYQKVKKDDLLGSIFNDIAQVNWNQHIPLICQFWSSIMLKTNEYHGNAYRKHVLLGKKITLTDAHFARWLKLFQETAIHYLPHQDAQLIFDKATLIAASLKLGASNLAPQSTAT
jgi:hemoglobin